MDPHIIDDFSTCDEYIEEVAGRSGPWYSYADTGWNQTSSIGSPGNGWSDQTCAAWVVGSCEDAAACEYAGIGFQLAEGGGYDLSEYLGVSIAIESDANIWFVVKTQEGGYFGGWMEGTSGTQTRIVAFSSLSVMSNSEVSSLDLTGVTEMQVNAGVAGVDFGFAIHRVALVD